MDAKEISFTGLHSHIINSYAVLEPAGNGRE